MKNDTGDRARLYSIRIIRSYLEYLRRYYQDIDPREILDYAGITDSALGDDGYWCTQYQVDRFQEKLVDITKNPMVSREAGRYTVSTRAYRTVRQYVSGLISPSTAYLMIPSIAAKLSKGSVLTVRTLGARSVELVSRPATGVREKEYQCQNRMGHIEALAEAFTGSCATVDHPACFHRGDGECRYVASWTEPRFLKLRKLRNLLLVFGLIFWGISLLLPSLPFALYAAFLFLILTAVITPAAWYSEKEEYKRQVADQSHAAEQLMHESKERADDARLILGIGQAISSVLDRDALLLTIMEALKDNLDFDRGAVLLASEDQACLQFRAGFGLDADFEDFLRKQDIILGNAGAEGLFARVFREMKPRMANGTGGCVEGLTPGLAEERLRQGASSCICIPLIFERKALGILYVDRLKPASPVGQSDLNRLLGVAPQIAISINNARTFERMEASEARYRGILDDIEEAYYEVDLEGRFTFFNPSIARTYGYSEEELRGLSYKEYMDDENIGKVFRAFHQVYSTGEPIQGLEWELADRDGRKLHVEASISLRRDAQGNPVGFKGITREITERRKAEEALRESRQMLQLILDKIPVRVFWKDRDSKYLGGNTRFIEDAGFSCVDEIIGKSDESMPWAEHTGLYRAHDMSVIETGMPELNYVQPERRADGSVAWLETSKLPLFDKEGNITGVLGVYEDITEKRGAEEALRASEARYRLLAENANDIIFTMDASLQFTYISPSVERIRGYTVEEAMTQAPGEILTPESLESAMQAFAEEMAIEADDARELARTRTLELEERCKDGSTIWTESIFTALRGGDNRFTGFLGITRDVTKRKKAEKALKKSEERYRLVAENARDVIWVVDMNLMHTFVSPSVKYLRGFTVAEDLKQTLDQRLTPESYARVMEMFNREMPLELGGQKHGPDWSYTLDLEMNCKDGSTVWAEVTMTLIYDEEGNLSGFMGISRDISDWKKADEERRRLENRLIQAQKMESIGTLAGGIAHDFNNLLTGILGNVSLVLLKMDESDPLRERLKNIEEYVQRGSDLTKQLLGFARGGKYEVKPTDLGEFIRKSSSMFGRTKKEIRVHYRSQKGLWPVDVDRGQLEQVLLNLYVNAWQAMPGGGDLYLSVENTDLGMRDVSPHGVNPGKYVKITVTDTGVGMDEATRVRIFEPFFTTKERGRGTGLGLASVYGIVKNHGGFITVESRVSEGTSFTICLPASDKEVEDSARPRDAVQRGHETILLVDDEVMILDIGARMLEGLGYSVLTAPGGREGVKAYQKDRDRIGMVILDMIMPGCSGRETFDLLHALNPSVRVLLASGYSLDGQAKEIMDKGCRGFIQKPFTMAELSRKIRGVLDE